MKINQISSQPLIVEFEDFLTEDECNHIIEISRGKLERSQVIDENSISEDRTSYQTGFLLNQTDIIKNIEERISNILNCPLLHQEGFNVVCYESGQFYSPHYDWFDKDCPIEKEHYHNNQRIITVIFYLNDDFTGGCTEFPEVNIKIIPKRGKALMFSNIDEYGIEDELTLHQGCPPRDGTKWIANKWVREMEF